MATAFNLVDYRTIQPVRRARLKLVEPVRAPVAASVSAPVAAPAPVSAPVPEVETAVTSSSTPKATPPAWMVAPPFRIEPAVSVHEQQAAYHVAPAPLAGAPYQSVREVPRAAW